MHAYFLLSPQLIYFTTDENLGKQAQTIFWYLLYIVVLSLLLDKASRLSVPINSAPHHSTFGVASCMGSAEGIRLGGHHSKRVRLYYINCDLNMQFLGVLMTNRSRAVVYRRGLLSMVIQKNIEVWTTMI